MPTLPQPTTVIFVCLLVDCEGSAPGSGEKMWYLASGLNPISDSEAAFFILLGRLWFWLRGVCLLGLDLENFEGDFEDFGSCECVMRMGVLIRLVANGSTYKPNSQWEQ
jgi:hypothetical protein